MIKTEVIGLDELVKGLHKLDKQVNTRVDNEMKRSALRVLNDAKQTVPVAYARLKKSGKIEHMPGDVRVSFGAGYAQWVEFGRRAGKWPPREPIEDWVKKKGIDIPAFLIQRAIGKRGTKKQPFLFPAFMRERARFKSGLKDIIK